MALSPKTADRRLTLNELLQWLIDDGMIDQERADTLSAVSQHMDKKLHPLELIARHNWENLQHPGQVMNLDFLCRWLAERLGMDYYHFDPLSIDVPSITQVMSYAYANRYEIIAVKVSQNEITVATAEPFVREWISEVEDIQHKQITTVFANPDHIRRHLVEYYALSKSVGRATATTAAPTAPQSLEQLTELGRAGKLDANDHHIVGIVDWLLQYAYAQRASDIHLEPRHDFANVRFRIDGVMHEVYQIPASIQASVTSRLKILGGMDLSEKRRPQDGRIKTRSPDGEEVELRLSTMPTAFGEKLVMRIFDPTVLVKDFSELGFLDDELKQWQAMTSRPNGIILVTGPTGSGKTTTLYTTLKALATPDVNVCTVEDPIELIEPSFNQMQVNQQIGLDFATGVRTLMRQDPDIIMVGEIRDRETAEMAIQAALTGHLVFSTLHTNDAPSAITRLLDIGVPPYLLRATIIGVLGQRLVRNLCPHCRTQGTMDEQQWESLIAPWKVATPRQIYRNVGCLECRETGFLGRSGLYEIMPLTNLLKAQVTADCDLVTLRRTAIKEGMKPLRLNGAVKIAKGITTIEEVMKVASLYE